MLTGLKASSPLSIADSERGERTDIPRQVVFTNYRFHRRTDRRVRRYVSGFTVAMASRTYLDRERCERNRTVLDQERDERTRWDCAR